MNSLLMSLSRLTSGLSASASARLMPRLLMMSSIVSPPRTGYVRYVREPIPAQTNRTGHPPQANSPHCNAAGSSMMPDLALRRRSDKIALMATRMHAVLVDRHVILQQLHA